MWKIDTYSLKNGEINSNKKNEWTIMNYYDIEYTYYYYIYIYIYLLFNINYYN